MNVRVLAFARIREILGASECVVAVPPAARIEDAWSALCEMRPELHALGASTRIARNGRIASRSDAIGDGDELALLPPTGGG